MVRPYTRKNKYNNPDMMCERRNCGRSADTGLQIGRVYLRLCADCEIEFWEYYKQFKDNF